MNAHSSSEVQALRALQAKPVDGLPDPQADAQALSRSFTQAMRQFASAVSVITVEHEGQRSGFTATSVSSFCAEPPTLLISTRQSSSSAALLLASGCFGVNLLAPEHQALAQRFTGFGGETGEQRYAGARWLQASAGGAPLLADSVLAFDCSVDECLQRHGHLLIFGRVRALHQPLAEGADMSEAAQRARAPLLYWQGRYQQLGAAL